jgi:hypothetical protein
MPQKRGAPGARALLVIAGLLALAAPSRLIGQQQTPVIAVATAEELIKAVGPDRTILMQDGDYRLSDAYGITSAWVDWRDSGSGKELAIRNLGGLTMQGTPGSRIIVDSNTAGLLDLEKCSNIKLDTLVFSRSADEDADISGGGIRAEGCTNFYMDSCSLEGKSGVLLELRDDATVHVGKSRIMNGAYGAVRVTGSSDVVFDGCTFYGNNGSPLLSIGDSGDVTFDTCVFSENQGGTFVDISEGRTQSGYVGFTACGFRNDAFDYFANGRNLPVTEDCSFDRSSFDEDWETKSVAPAQDAGSAAPAALDYAFQGTGLEIEYPASWELQEGEKNSRAAFYGPEGRSVLVFTPLGIKVAEDASVERLRQAFDDASAALAGILKSEAAMRISLAIEGDPETTDPGGLAAATYTGSARRAGGAMAALRVRFIASGGAIYALAAMADDASMLGEGGDIEGILASFTSVK